MNLNAINRLAQQQGRAPWSLSFSFGRSLQVGLGAGCGVVRCCSEVGPCQDAGCFGPGRQAG